MPGEQDGEIRILLVEDESGMRAAIVELLRHDRHIREIREAENLLEAFHILEKHHIDVIVLDLNLPDSKGADSVESMIVRYPEIPIVVLTALDLTTPLLDALVVAGAFACMSKNALFHVSLATWIERAFTNSKGLSLSSGDTYA